ncbi:MAG: efflux RND transporter periplasmic adaptor subunit [Phycisphaerales bacterium]
MANVRSSHRLARWLGASLVFAGFAAGVVALMLWLVGAFHGKIAGHGAASERARPVGGAATVEVVERTIPLEEIAVGTIQPVHRIEVASRLLAKVLEVNVTAGQKVAKDEVLVRLEDTDLKARLAQAEFGAAQAQAAVDQARIEAARAKAAFDENAVSRIELDRVNNALKGAEANLARMEQSRAETQTVLGYATIRSTIDGVVVDKRVNPGDTVTPGQVVVTILDPTRMQLVASVRESLSRRLSVGGTVSVKVDAMDHACAGTVSEIVPEAEASSRSFQVKVSGPCPPGVYAGMFGRLLIPIGDESVLVIPRTAVRSIGQLDSVDVVVDGTRARRAVRLGRAIDGEVEVLSGLKRGERVVVDAQPAPSGGR